MSAYVSNKAQSVSPLLLPWGRRTHQLQHRRSSTTCWHRNALQTGPLHHQPPCPTCTLGQGRAQGGAVSEAPIQFLKATVSVPAREQPPVCSVAAHPGGRAGAPPLQLTEDSGGIIYSSSSVCGLHHLVALVACRTLRTNDQRVTDKSSRAARPHRSCSRVPALPWCCNHQVVRISSSHGLGDATALNNPQPCQQSCLRPSQTSMGHTKPRIGGCLALTVLYCTVTVGVVVAAAPDYPTFAAALQDQKNNLTTFYLIASTASLGNATAFINDTNSNAVLLVATNDAVNAVIKEFNADPAVTDGSLARAAIRFLTIPQRPGTINAVLDLTDGISLNTSLTSSTDDANATAHTLTTLTFRDEGQGKWYVGGSPPGAQLDISNTLTCGAGRLYILNGFPIPPSKVITTANSPAKFLSVAEALQPRNVPAVLSTFAELALADATIKAMLSGPDLTITIFAPSNQAWSDYLSSKGTTLAAFKGSKEAKDVLLGCMAVQRPYTIAQFPVGLTSVTDPLNRTYRLVSNEQASDDNPQAKLISNRNSRLLAILPAPARNFRGGKSVIHGIDGVLIPEPSSGNPSPNSPAFGLLPIPDAPTPTPSNATTGSGSASSSSDHAAITNNSDSSSGGLSTGKKIGVIVGVAVSVTAALAIVGFAAACLMKRRPHWRQQQWSTHAGKAQAAAIRDATGTAAGPHMDLPGVHRGIFTRLVAHEFQWTEYTPVPGVTMSVEAGITDTQLDRMATQEENGTGQHCPVVKLTKEDVKEQLVLLKNGILGKGATAMVFQCLWPSRFGPDALLAAKVLKEGSDADPQYLQSFAYEAAVLSSLLHPNVVRLYGYCLEPPTVVLILELMPTSLKRMLYDAEPSATHAGTPRASDGMAGKEVLWTQALTSTQLPAAPHPTAHGKESSMHASSDHQQTGLFSSPSALSSVFHSGTQQHAGSNQPGSATSNALVSPSSGQADAAVTITMQPTKAAVRKLTMQQVLTVSADIAAALAFMHDRAGEELQPASPFHEPITHHRATKVVHRDLKPANILVNSKGRAKISDFGLARQHHQTTIGTQHLGAGTLPYMAPELLLHASVGSYVPVSATNRVDIYSLAMLIWEQLAGQPPWQGSADAALVFAVTQGRRPPLPEPPASEPDLHVGLLQQPASLNALPQLNAIVRACWRQRELKRPTATAVLHELNSLLAKLGVPVDEMPTSPNHVTLNLLPSTSAATTISAMDLSSPR